MSTVAERPKPILVPELCKGCGRCIDACQRGCIALGSEINQVSGLVPISIDLETCNGCALCISSCPEPFALTLDGHALEDGPRISLNDAHPRFEPIAQAPGDRIPLPAGDPLILKGNHAAAVGAILAGCRHVFGYPITPSTEGAELMARLLPSLGGVFLQAVSEVATVNHMYGCGGAGLPCMTFTSSPGFSLMLEGISYMIGAEVPGVFMNVMRGGPGLGNIAPEQSDIKLACRGLGHGNTHAVVLAPSTPQEMLDFTMDAFRIAFTYRNPVVVLGDGYLGQITGRVKLPRYMRTHRVPDWAVHGDAEHRRNLICSIYLAETELQAHNRRLDEKYEYMQREARVKTYMTDGARVLVVAANTPARMARGAVDALRRRGVEAGLFQPLTLWPFPVDMFGRALRDAEELVIVEASSGQLEDEVRLAASHAGLTLPPVSHVRRAGGVLPQVEEIVDHIETSLGVAP